MRQSLASANRVDERRRLQCRSVVISPSMLMVSASKSVNDDETNTVLFRSFAAAILKCLEYRMCDRKV